MSNFELIKKYNEAYRLGNPIVSDEEYDNLYDTLTEDEKEELGVGLEPTERKQKLPYPMFSMDKLKQYDELSKWMKSKNIPENTQFVVTPKYDGLSLLCDTNFDNDRYYTRGNGVEGQRSDDHFSIIQSTLRSVPKVEELTNTYIVGEVIMSKDKFNSKYAEKYKNARNLVAGLMNHKTPQLELEDVNYIRYGVGNEDYNKVESLELLNKINHVRVPFCAGTINTYTETVLNDLYERWRSEYEIDGIIIEVNDKDLRKKLGRERNGNPAYARAIKIFAEDSARTTINAHTLNVSKDGRISVVGQVTPVKLDGVLISNVTLNNYKAVLEEGWQVGAEVEIKRSGQVIPKIIKTITRGTGELPTHCPCCDTKLEWCPTQTNLVCNNKTSCKEQKISEIISFMSIMGIENVGEGVVNQLFDYGIDTIRNILDATENDFLNVEGFAKRKAELVHKNIHSKLKDVELSKLQHSMNFFPKLGSKKLKLLEQFDSKDNIPTKEQIVSIEGFSEISADIYLNGIHKFWETIETLPITIAKKKEIVLEGNKCSGWNVCFTGVRSKDTEDLIVSNGGKIASGVSKNTTILCCKDIDSTSGKVKKARDLGIEIVSLEMLKEML